MSALSIELTLLSVCVVPLSRCVGVRSAARQRLPTMSTLPSTISGRRNSAAEESLSTMPSSHTRT